MRFLLLFITLFLMIPEKGWPGGQPAQKLTSFSDKEIPEQLQGCGDSYYLTAGHRKKQDAIVCCANEASAMISINNHIIVFTKSFQFAGYQSQGYTLLVKNGHEKQMGSEYYQMMAKLIVKFGNKIIWAGEVFGDGGC